MGGPRLTPGEAVDALAEAIEIIRQVWDTGARGGVRVLGAHHRVAGAKRGPAPAHPIGIWVGAYKPRMRQNIWTMGAYCESYCRVVTGHHALEDASVFPHRRARERELSPVLDRLQVEHVAIHEVLDSVDRALVNFIAKPDDFGELDEAINLLSDTLLSHLAYTERELIEPLARHGFYSV